jgi:hypothetical protein
MAILLESDFLTVNLNSVINKQKATQNMAEPSVDREIHDWAQELEIRLANNKKLSAEAQDTDYVIEAKFFEDYFKANWEEPVAEQLISIGEPLKKAINVLGFDKQTNPILAFISDPFVIKELLETKLLNVSTFKAIYNAVAKKLVAHSQLLQANTYNIVYCPDLYKRSAAEMQEYLTLQNKTLPANASRYTKAMLNLNKKVFLLIPSITEKDFSKRLAQIKAYDKKLDVQTSKLNNIEMASDLDKSIRVRNTSKSSGATQSSNVSGLKKLDTPAKKLAAVQYFSTATNNTEAKEALMSSKFTEISNNDLIKASIELANDNALKKLLLGAEADEIIKLLGDL